MTKCNVKCVSLFLTSQLHRHRLPKRFCPGKTGSVPKRLLCEQKSSSLSHQGRVQILVRRGREERHKPLGWRGNPQVFVFGIILILKMFASVFRFPCEWFKWWNTQGPLLAFLPVGIFFLKKDGPKHQGHVALVFFSLRFADGSRYRRSTFSHWYTETHTRPPTHTHTHTHTKHKGVLDFCQHNICPPSVCLCIFELGRGTQLAKFN